MKNDILSASFESFLNGCLMSDDDSIAPPTKESDDNHIARHPSNFPEDIHVNINVNTRDIIRKNHPNLPPAEDKPTEDEELLADLSKNRNHDRLFLIQMHTGSITYSNINYLPSQESLVSFVKNMLTGMINTLSHIAYLFKTALFRGWRDFKRSELAEYFESNRVTMIRMRRATEDGFLLNTEVDVPTGMKGSYIEAIGSLLSSLTELNMPARIEQMKAVITSIQETLLSTSSFSSIVDAANRDFSNRKNIDIAFDKSNKFFTDGKNHVATFEKCHSSLAMMFSCIDTIIEKDVELVNVSRMYDKLMDIEDAVEMISESPSLERMSKNDLNTLNKVVTSWGYLFEKYSILINDLYRVNHCLFMNLKQVRKQLKM